MKSAAAVSKTGTLFLMTKTKRRNFRGGKTFGEPPENRVSSGNIWYTCETGKGHGQKRNTKVGNQSPKERPDSRNRHKWEH
jgi:hypothetical protein